MLSKGPRSHWDPFLLSNSVSRFVALPSVPCQPLGGDWAEHCTSLATRRQASGSAGDFISFSERLGRKSCFYYRKAPPTVSFMSSTSTSRPQELVAKKCRILDTWQNFLRIGMSIRAVTCVNFTLLCSCLLLGLALSVHSLLIFFHCIYWGMKK